MCALRASRRYFDEVYKAGRHRPYDGRDGVKLKAEIARMGPRL